MISKRCFAWFWILIEGAGPPSYFAQRACRQALASHTNCPRTLENGAHPIFSTNTGSVRRFHQPSYVYTRGVPCRFVSPTALQFSTSMEVRESLNCALFSRRKEMPMQAIYAAVTEVEACGIDGPAGLMELLAASICALRAAANAAWACASGGRPDPTSQARCAILLNSSGS